MIDNMGEFASRQVADVLLQLRFMKGAGIAAKNIGAAHFVPGDDAGFSRPFRIEDDQRVARRQKVVHFGSDGAEMGNRLNRSKRNLLAKTNGAISIRQIDN